MTSLRVPPTRLRYVCDPVQLQELAISFRVSCLREKPVDTGVSWIPNAANINPRRLHFAPLGMRTGTARQNCNNDLALLYVSEDLALYRIKPARLVNLADNTHNRILATPQVPHNHPNRSQSSKHPRTKAEYVFPVEGKAGVTFIET